MELASLTAPISGADPCGPDLDLEADADYLNFMAKVEGLLPASYFSVKDGRPFDRASIDFAAEFEVANRLLERTRDLRLLVVVAKLHILTRDLADFDRCVEAIATLLELYWDQVHPRGESGDYTLRMAAIETLDDLPTVVHPLQFVPLANHRRFGVITFRNYMTATGEIRPREDEEQPLDTGAIDKALMEADLPALVEVLHQLQALQASLGRVRSVWIERAGFGQAVNLDKSGQTVGKVLNLVNGIVARRDRSAAIKNEGVGAAAAVDVAGSEEALPSDPATVGPFASRLDALAALAAAAEYFSRFERSNPALLLVRQARQLVGCSFIEAMQLLVPAYVDQAFIAIGTQHVFELPIARLSIVEPESCEDASHGAAPADSAGEECSGENFATGSAADEQASGQRTIEPDVNGAQSPPRHARSRREALALLDQVAAYFRSAEPTSPVPVILDRARSVADRDFMSLLKDFLPESTLRSTVKEE